VPCSFSAGTVHAATADLDAIKAEITKRHEESVTRLKDWIAAPAIAAENRGYRTAHGGWLSSRRTQASSARA
jgi:hypothetical protein